MAVYHEICPLRNAVYARTAAEVDARRHSSTGGHRVRNGDVNFRLESWQA
jgi:hypothetical protein